MFVILLHICDRLFLYLIQLKPLALQLKTMRSIFYISMLVIVFGCTHQPKRIVKKVPPPEAVDTSSGDEKQIRYSDQQLEIFLDSVGKLPTQPLADKVAFGADSVFKDKIALDTEISLKDFEIIKRAARKGVMRVKTARRIFGNKHISYDCNDKDVLLTYKKGSSL